MTEREWLDSSYPQELLEYLLGRAGARQFRLFACACCRHREVWRLLRGQRSRALVEAAERFADAGAAWAEVVEAAAAAPWGRVSGGPWRSANPVRLPRSSQAERAVLALARADASEAAWGAVRG